MSHRCPHCGQEMPEMADLPPMVCVVCARQADATSDEADGWALVPHDVREGDDHCDSQWLCPEHADGSDIDADQTSVKQALAPDPFTAMKAERWLGLGA